ncbi:MAG: tail fiber protein [Sphingopyxis sp.]|nr:tail fiber protein [Sphingopyxis sp.]
MRHTRILSLGAASALAVAASTPAVAQDYYIGQLIEVGGTYCPKFFQETNGQVLPIAQNQALFALLGTTYGGNGVTTFNLPDLRGRMGISLGQGPGLQNYTQGQIGGSEQVTLTLPNLPIHSHTGVFETSTSNANDNKSFRNAFAVTADNQYTNSTNLDVTMNSETITVQGAGDVTSTVAPMMSPFLVTRYCIATAGVFPSRN